MMGYTTQFDGKLTFTQELSGSQLAHLKTILGEDRRDHSEWDMHDNDSFYFIDLELLDDFSGLKWDGSEKTYGMDDVVRNVITEMKKVMPNFGLHGKLAAQGEDIEDRWILEVDENVVKTHDVAITGKKVLCPHCENTVIVEEAEVIE